MSNLEFHQFPARSDNYGVLVHDPDANQTASIDAPDARAVRDALAEKGWKLTHILTTHHHGDHVAGNTELKRETGCIIVGPRAEASSIPGIDVMVGEDDAFKFGEHEVRILETPGHTAGHISYWIPEAGVAFVGDTLFAMGCGRLFEGTPQIMWDSLCKFEALPDDTVIYCGHEYTQSNAAFALTIEPQNKALKARVEEVAELRRAGRPTLPTTMAKERATNPFLRASSPEIRANLDMDSADDWQVFAEVRARKDRA